MSTAGRAAFRRLTPSVFIPAVCIAVGHQATLILLPLYALEVGGGAAAAAAVLGMRGIGTMLADVPAGVAVTRLGDKVTMAAGTLTVAVACTGFALAAAPWVLGLLALVLGAGFGALMLGRLNYVARQCPVADVSPCKIRLGWQDISRSRTARLARGASSSTTRGHPLVN